MYGKHINNSRLLYPAMLNGRSTIRTMENTTGRALRMWSSFWRLLRRKTSTSFSAQVPTFVLSEIMQV